MSQFKLRSKGSSDGGGPGFFKERIARNKQYVSSNRRLVITLIFIVLLAFILRVFFAFDVAVADGYAFSGGSSAAYHVRVIEYIMGSGTPLINDAALNYPYGETNVNPPLMDYLFAIVAKIVTFFGVSSTAAASGVLIWSTPIFGALTCVPIYYLAKDMFGHRAGIVSALLYTICAIAISQSVLSNGTEAAFYGFFFVLMVYFLHKAVKACSNDVPDREKGNFKGYAKGVYAQNRAALKYALIAGLMLTIVELSWNGFRPIVIMVAFIMVVQALLDRVRSKDSTSVTLIFATVLVVSTVISAPVYALCGLWSLVYSGPFLIVILSVVAAAVISETKGRPWLLVIPILVIALVAVMAVLWLAVPGLYSDIVGGNSIYSDPTFVSLVDMNSSVSLSTMAGYYGWLTMWFPYILIALLLFKFREQFDSRGKTFVLLWMIAMMAVSWSGSVNVYLAAPAYVIGGGAMVAWILDKADIKEYFASFKGIGFRIKAFLKKLLQPIPLVSLLMAVFLVAAPNAMYAIDSSVSTNQKSDSSGAIADYAGAFGYYVKNNDDWKMNDLWDYYSEKDKSGSMVSWWDYSAEAIANGGFTTVAGANGAGAAAASNILLSDSSSSTISMAIRLIEYEGIDGFRDYFMNALNMSEDDFNKLKDIVQNPGKYRSDILKNPDKYGNYTSSLTDENAMYIASAYFLMNEIRDGSGLTVIEIAELYDHVCDASDKDITYLVVSRGMFPIAYGDGSVFSTLAYMNNYYLDSYGAPTDFYSVSSSGTYTYTDAMYETMIWKAYIGYSPSDLGYSSAITMLNAFAASDGSENTRPQPGYGLSNYVISYWKVLYNADSEATEDSDGWVEMDAYEAMRLQDGKLAKGEDGGLINFMSGLPVVLEYVGIGNSQLVSGTVTVDDGGTSVPVEGARVALFDKNGSQFATVFTDENGEYKMYVPVNHDSYSSGKLVYSVGSNTQSGGLVIETLSFTADSLPSSYDVAVESVDYAGEIYYVDLDDEADLKFVTGNLTVKIVGSAHGHEDEIQTTDGRFAFTGLVPDAYTVTVYDENGNSIATGTYQAAIGHGDEIRVRLFLTTATVTLNITDEFGSPYNGYAQLTSTGEDDLKVVTEVVDGKAEAKVAPGTYVVRLLDSDTEDAWNSTHDLFDAQVTVASGGSGTVTAKAQMFAELTFGGISGERLMHATNGSYTTAAIVDNSSTLRVPVSVEPTQYYFYYTYSESGQTKMDWAGETLNSGAALDVTGFVPLDTYEYSRTIMSTEGEATPAFVTFYPSAVGTGPIISTWSVNGKMSVWLPAGIEYVMHVYSDDSDVKEAYVGTVMLSSASRGGEIQMVSAKTMIVEVLFSDSGSGRIPYAYLEIIDSNSGLTIYTVTDADGLFSHLMPGDGSYSFRVHKTIGSFNMVGTADANSMVTQKAATSTNYITSIFRTSTPTEYTNKTGITFVYIDENGDEQPVEDGVEVKLKLSAQYSSEVTFETFNSDGTLDFGSYALSIGTWSVDIEKDQGYYYDGTMVLYQSDAPVKIVVERLTAVTFEDLGENDKVSVTALDTDAGSYYSEDREPVKDAEDNITGYTQLYYFEYGKRFQVTVTDDNSEKVWYYYHYEDSLTTVADTQNVALEEYIEIKGFAGYPAAGLVTIEFDNGTIVKVSASSTGIFNVKIPKSVTSAAFTSELNKYTDANDDEVYAYIGDVKIATYEEMEKTGRVNLIATGVKDDVTTDDLTVTSMITSYDTDTRSVEVTVDVDGNAYQSLFLTGGAGWDEITFYDGAVKEIGHINGNGPAIVSFIVKATYSKDVGADSQTLSITFKNAAGTTIFTYYVDISEAITSSGDVTVERGDSDVYGDSEYKFAIVVNNESNVPKDYFITAPTGQTSLDGWYLVFTDSDSNEVRDATTTLTFTASAQSETTVYAKLVNDNAEKLPESFVVNVIGDTTTDITIQPTAAVLDVDGGGASGPNIFNSEGSIPTYIWIMVVISILMFVLILWLGMKRGVFLRKR